MATPRGMKYYTFELLAVNVSKSGLLLRSNSSAFVPFRVGNKLNLTFDFLSVHFTRPIHMLVEVTRVEQKEDRFQYFGVKILSIEKSQLSIFTENLATLPEMS